MRANAPRLLRLCLCPRLSYRRCGTADGRLLGAPAQAHFFRTELLSGRMRVPHRGNWLFGGRLNMLHPELPMRSIKRLSTVFALTCTLRSIAETGRSRRLFSPTSVIWAWTGRRIHRKTSASRIRSTLWSLLGSRAIEEFGDLPLMSDAFSPRNARCADQGRACSSVYRP